MFFTRFLEGISSLVPVRGLKNPEALARLNPAKIYVENVRNILGVNTSSAKRICETAVRQGLFHRYVEVLCPNGVAAAVAQSEDDLPPTVHCWKEEEDGNFEECDIPTASLPKTVFYRLNETDTREPHGQPA